jgi:SAM-dependent methyltransferase
MDKAFYTYGRFDGWGGAVGAVKSLIACHGAQTVLEVGSGANPTLSPEDVAALGIDYTVNDASMSELAKADQVYRRLVMDVSAVTPSEEMLGTYDFVFSRMVNEHVRDGRRYFENIHRLLKPGGITAHWFSTLYSLPFIANRVMPEVLGELLLQVFAPRDKDKKGKFTAYYSWSRGPCRRMQKRFESLGYEVLRYNGYYGHSYYQLRLPWLHLLEMRKAAWLAAHPIASLTSYAHIVLRKRDSSQ